MAADVTENAKKWTANQLVLQHWLALPSDERNPKTQDELAKQLGVNPVTVTRWKRIAGFMDAVYEIAESHLGNDMADIYAALRKEAKAGSFQHIKLALELTGRYVEKREVNNKGALSLTWNDGDTDNAAETA